MTIIKRLDNGKRIMTSAFARKCCKCKRMIAPNEKFVYFIDINLNPAFDKSWCMDCEAKNPPVKNLLETQNV